MFIVVLEYSWGFDYRYTLYSCRLSFRKVAKKLRLHVASTTLAEKSFYIRSTGGYRTLPQWPTHELEFTFVERTGIIGQLRNCESIAYTELATDDKTQEVDINLFYSRISRDALMGGYQPHPGRVMENQAP